MKELLQFFSMNGMPEYKIRGRSRKQPTIFWRHAFCYIALKKLGCSLSQIGEELNRHHSTIINSVNEAKSLIVHDEWFKGLVGGIEENFDFGQYISNFRTDKVKCFPCSMKQIFPK